MPQNGGDGQDGGGDNWRARVRAGATEVPRVGRTSLASASAVQAIAWLVFLRHTFLIPGALLPGAAAVPAARRQTGRSGAVCARARPAQTQGRARRPRQTVALHVVLARRVQSFHRFETGVCVIVGNPVLLASAGAPALQTDSCALQFIFTFLAKSRVSHASSAVIPRTELKLTGAVPSHTVGLPLNSPFAQVAILVYYTSLADDRSLVTSIAFDVRRGCARADSVGALRMHAHC